jgi:hypothetical protein
MGLILRTKKKNKEKKWQGRESTPLIQYSAADFYQGSENTWHSQVWLSDKLLWLKNFITV